MDKSILKPIWKCAIFGIVWAILLFGIALIITNFKDYTLKDVLFIEGIVLIMVSFFISWLKSNWIIYARLWSK